MKVGAADGGGGEDGLVILEFGVRGEEGFSGEADLLALFRGDGGER